MIPGSNLLKQAHRLIRPSEITYYRQNGRTTNAIGLDVANYDTGVCIRASVQPVNRKHYQRMGLEYNKIYINVFSIQDVNDLARGRSGDQIAWNGKRFEVMGQSDWSAVDNWNGFLAVEVSNE